MGVIPPSSPIGCGAWWGSASSAWRSGTRTWSTTTNLRHDPVLGALLGRFKPDEAAPARLAGKSTLNRLEHAPADAAGGRYHKIGHDAAAIETVFVALFLDAFRAKPPRAIILDLDATDDPIHGHQEGRFFHGYYDCHCYLPL